jgi:hypothetical protein
VLVALLILCLVARRRRARQFAQSGGGPILVGPSGGTGKPPFGGFARPWGQNNAANQNQFHNQGFQQPSQTAQPGTEYPPNHGAAPVPPPYTPDHNAASFSSVSLLIYDTISFSSFVSPSPPAHLQDTLHRDNMLRYVSVLLAAFHPLTPSLSLSPLVPHPQHI